MKVGEKSVLDLGFVNRLTEIPITDRQKEILIQIAHGQTNKQISEKLHLSPSTVRNHISNIFTRLKISNRSQATAIAIYSGIVPSSQFQNQWTMNSEQCYYIMHVSKH